MVGLMGSPARYFARPLHPWLRHCQFGQLYLLCSWWFLASVLLKANEWGSATTPVNIHQCLIFFIFFKYYKGFLLFLLFSPSHFCSLNRISLDFSHLQYFWDYVIILSLWSSLLQSKQQTCSIFPHLYYF